jgi:hypothetical protein
MHSLSLDIVDDDYVRVSDIYEGLDSHERHINVKIRKSQVTCFAIG